MHFLRSVVMFWMSYLHNGLISPVEGEGQRLLQIMAISLGSCRLFTMQISSGSLKNYSRSFRERRRRTWAQFELELWFHSLSNFSAQLHEAMPLSSAFSRHMT